jgi:hypothetical protein
MRISALAGLSVTLAIAVAIALASALSGTPLGALAQFSLPLFVLWVAITAITLVREGKRSLWLLLPILPILLAATPIILIYIACGFYNQCP